VNRYILYARESYRSPEVKSFVRNRAKFNEECFGSWEMKTIVSDTHIGSCVTFLQMFNDIGDVVMRLRNDNQGHKRMNTLHPVGSNWIARIPHISRMWDAIIIELFENIKVEVGTLYVPPTPEVSLGLLPDTDDDVPHQVEEEVEEYDVIGDVHPM
jgi:hypothetical protein